MSRLVKSIIDAGDAGNAVGLSNLAKGVRDIFGSDPQAEDVLALLTHHIAIAPMEPSDSGTPNTFYLRILNRRFPGVLRSLGELPRIRGVASARRPAQSGGSSFSFADLFAGIGGFHIALARVGGRCVFASEWDTNSKITYAINHGLVPFGDIRDITRDGKLDRDRREIRGLVPEVDVVAAGFPCQPFSLAGVSSRNHHGREHGLKCDTQGTLFHDIVLIAKAVRPKILLLENVKNLASHDGGNTIRVILEEIMAAGYQVFPENFGQKGWAIIDSQAVSAQRRKRVYLVCIRKDIAAEKGGFEFPDLSFDKPAATLRDVISADSSLTDREKFDRYGISHRLWRSHKSRDRRHRERSNGFSTNFMYDLDQPAPTLVARYYKDGKDCLIPHRDPSQPPRMLTPQECAILQTFPGNFWIPKSKSVAYKQFGNSITVDVAHHIAVNIVAYLEDRPAPRVRSSR